MVRAVILWLLLQPLQLVAATVQLSSGWSATVNDFNCQTVISAFLTTLGASSGDCNFQSAGVGTALVFRNSAGASVGSPTISSVTGWVVPTGGGALQTQVNTIQTQVNSLQTTVNDITTRIGSLLNGQGISVSDLAILGIDAASILYVFSWGFGAVVMFSFLGYCIGAAKLAIRKL